MTCARTLLCVDDCTRINHGKRSLHTFICVDKCRRIDRSWRKKSTKIIHIDNRTRTKHGETGVQNYFDFVPLAWKAILLAIGIHTRDHKNCDDISCLPQDFAHLRNPHCIRSSNRKQIKRQQEIRKIGPHPDPNDDQHVQKMTDVLHGPSFNTCIAHGHLHWEEKSSVLLTQNDRALLCNRETKGPSCVDAKQKSCSVFTERHLRQRQSIRGKFLTVDAWWQETVQEGWQSDADDFYHCRQSWQGYSQHTNCNCKCNWCVATRRTLSQTEVDMKTSLSFSPVMNASVKPFPPMTAEAPSSGYLRGALFSYQKERELQRALDCRNFIMLSSLPDRLFCNTP